MKYLSIFLLACLPVFSFADTLAPRLECNHIKELSIGIIKAREASTPDTDLINLIQQKPSPIPEFNELVLALIKEGYQIELSEDTPTRMSQVNDFVDHSAQRCLALSPEIKKP